MRMRALFAVALCSVVALGQEPDCVDEASNQRLFIELAQRGITSYGCWATEKYLARWAPADNALYYELEVTGTGPIYTITRTQRYIAADSTYTYWPVGVDTFTARVRGFNENGPGPWSETSTTIVEE